MLAFRRYFGSASCQIAALAMAVSPGMVFYGRYAIHESWLLFFLLLTAWGFAGLWQFGERQHLWAAVLGVTGMMLTKETYVIHVVAMLLAVPALFALEQVSRSAPAFIAGQRWARGDLKTAALVGASLIFFFYSGGLLDWSALPGIWETFSTWIATGTRGETGHEKEWSYWLALLARYEWPALLGLIAAPFIVMPGTQRMVRFFAIYGLGALIAYSLVAYKTPWCLIVLMWPFLFLFGLALDQAFSRFDRWIVGALALVVAGYSLAATCLLNFNDYADETEPYVYVQTTTDVNKLADPLLFLAARDPVNYHLKGYLLTLDTHPMNWLLGDFTSVAVGDEEHLPTKVDDAEFLIIDQSSVEQIEPKLSDTYFKETVRLRGSSAEISVLYFRETTFRPFFTTRAAEFRPALNFD